MHQAFSDILRYSKLCSDNVLCCIEPLLFCLILICRLSRLNPSFASSDCFFHARLRYPEIWHISALSEGQHCVISSFCGSYWLLNGGITVCLSEETIVSKFGQVCLHPTFQHDAELGDYASVASDVIGFHGNRTLIL